MGRQYRTPRQGELSKLVTGNVIAASSTAVAIPNYDITDLSTYAAGDYVMDAPSEGVRKTLVWASSASAAVVVRLSTATSVKAGHTGATQITFGLTTSDGCAVLIGLNSTRWAVESMIVPSTLANALSTVASVKIASS